MLTQGRANQDAHASDEFSDETTGHQSEDNYTFKRHCMAWDLRAKEPSQVFMAGVPFRRRAMEGKRWLLCCGWVLEYTLLR